MSNRYINKAVRKDIYSNSGAIFTYNYVDKSNLELLNINPETKTIELSSSYSNNVSGILLPIPIISWNNIIQADWDDGSFVDEGCRVLWSETSTDAIKNVVYLGTFASHPTSGNTGGFYIWRNSSYGNTLKLYYDGDKYNNENVVILSVLNGSSESLPEELYADAYTTSNNWATLQHLEVDLKAPDDIESNPGSANAPYFYNYSDELYYYFDVNGNLKLLADKIMYIDRRGFQLLGEARYPLYGGINLTASVAINGQDGNAFSGYTKSVDFETGASGPTSTSLNLELSTNTNTTSTSFFNGYASTNDFNSFNGVSGGTGGTGGTGGFEYGIQLTNGTVISNSWIIHNWAIAVGQSFNNPNTNGPFPVTTAIPLLYFNVDKPPIFPIGTLPPNGGLFKYCPINNIYSVL